VTEKHKQNTIPKIYHNTRTKILNTNLRLINLINVHKYVLSFVLPQQDFLDNPMTKSKVTIFNIYLYISGIINAARSTEHRILERHFVSLM